LTGACAQVSPLEGGPIDTIPPKLISSYPMHESTGFQDKNIQLTFDKEIDVQDIYNRLIVTPRLTKLEGKPSYVYKVQGRTLKLKLASPLEAATTYTFNFKDAIKDTREGTAAESPTITFSTGAYVDSMYVSGKVKYLMTDKPSSNTLVSLYKVTEEDTLHILNSVPDYFTKTNEEGHFKLDHIKQGQYRIYAGHSEENKLIIDPSKEAYGFLTDPIDLSEPIENLMLAILQADVTEFKLQGKQPQNQYFEINFSKPVVKYTLALVHKPKRFKEDYLYSNLIKNGHIIRIYNTLGLLEEDSLEARLVAADSMGSIIEETIDIHFSEGRAAKEPLTYTFSPPSGAKVRPAFEGSMLLSKPVRDVLTDSLFFVVNDQDTIQIAPEDLHFKAQRDSIIIRKQLDLCSVAHKVDEETTGDTQVGVVLHIAKGAFVAVDKELNKAVRYHYTLQNPQSCGTIKGRVTTQAAGFIIQLLNEQYEVVDEIRNEPYYQFQDVLPGNYRLRILVLQDGDAEWRFGNINQLEPPDPVIFYPHELSIVANWELDYIDFEF
ncbi:MAG: Ig-like domain-containing domain, partial [Bacteroidota bacterium]